VHFGVGGFHRAHQAMYVDRLLEKGKAQGVGHLRRRRDAGRPRMADVMARRTACTRWLSSTPTAPRRAGDRVDRRLPLAPDDPEAVIELLAAPRRGSSR
jgi:mannitol 2-dehydrogenase